MLKVAVSLLVLGAILAIVRIAIGIWFGESDVEVSLSFIRTIAISRLLEKVFWIAGAAVLLVYLATRLFQGDAN